MGGGSVETWEKTEMEDTIFEQQQQRIRNKCQHITYNGAGVNERKRDKFVLLFWKTVEKIKDIFALFGKTVEKI